MNRLTTALLLLSTLLTGCTPTPRRLTVEIVNPLDTERSAEMVEIPVQDLIGRLQPNAGEAFTVQDTAGRALPCQLTYDDKLIFLASAPANGKSTYRIQTGRQTAVKARTAGRATSTSVVWENDRIAFHAARHRTDTSGLDAGYGVWVKNTAELLSPRWTEQHTPPLLWKIGKTVGRDCHPAGKRPRPGATLVAEPSGNVVWPEGWSDFEILDNGPLRTTVRLLCRHRRPAYSSLYTTETRTLSLDAGSHLCHIVLRYEHPDTGRLRLLTVLPLPAAEAPFTAETELGLLARTEPVDSTAPASGLLHTGCVFPHTAIQAGLIRSGQDETALRRAAGYLFARTAQQPGATYEYYFGAAWSNGPKGIRNASEWVEYLTAEARKLRHPLNVSLR